MEIVIPFDCNSLTAFHHESYASKLGLIHSVQPQQTTDYIDDNDGRKVNGWLEAQV